MLRLLVVVAAGSALLVGGAGTTLAQAPEGWAALELEIERADLERLQVELDARIAEGRGTAHERAQADIHRDVVRRRLAEGDFRPGDQVRLTVAGEPTLSDTFVVDAGPVLALPMVGDVPLHGVLRSELEPHLTTAVARVIRDPIVRARSLVQVSVLGEVERPGFYVVTPDALLSDALMQAGGPTREARMDRLRIERAAGGLDSPELIPDARVEAWSVNELGLRTGDRVIVPRGSGITTRDVVSFSLMGVTLLASLLAVL